MEETARIAIGALSKHTGTNIETIRYYERVGLLPAPARSSGGYRLYGTGHLKRLNFIRRARILGFSIGEVRTLLQLADERKRPCAEVRVVAEAHLKDVRAKIADLRRMERVLKATVARCAEGRRSDCPRDRGALQERPGGCLITLRPDGRGDDGRGPVSRPVAPGPRCWRERTAPRPSSPFDEIKAT